MASTNRPTEHVVISGISGVFPMSADTSQFRDNLAAGKYLLEETDRWGPDFDDVPNKIGAVKNIDRFDYSFFRVHRKQAEKMDVASRILLEKTFEAIVDAGYNPQQLKGTNTAVYYANHSEGTMSNSLHDDNEYAVLGKAKSMIANRISYWLDVHGPSMALDTACSSSFYGLDCAFKAIRNGDCDAAIVCASSLCLSPITSRAFLRLGILDPTATSRPFDARASGFSRGEAAVVVFVQKRDHARRIYADVLHTKTNCDGFKHEGIAHPSDECKKQLYREFYREIRLDPNTVSYVEAHGTATQVGDTVEVNGIEEIFCANRDQPLMIGSVKSNMGHGEASSGLCSVIKLILSFELGYILPTINFEIPNPKITAFSRGSIKIATEPIPCTGDLYAVNSFGIGGTNAHMLLSPFRKEKSHSSPSDRFSRLVVVSGRTEEAIDALANSLEENCTDDEYVALMREIFADDINGHLYRGFVLLRNDGQHKRHFTHFSGEIRPIWYIFSGMGSQWPTMGKALMDIPAFADSIKRSHEILQSEGGIDLIATIVEDRPGVLDDVLNASVGIVAIQIALVDTLKKIGIEPDGVIGHSIGELGCAYADGCLTARQTILVAYHRGLVLLESDIINGSMAVVGTNYDTLRNIIPADIDIACHNAPDNYTVSGPTDRVRHFVDQLRSHDVFVREVGTSHVPFHSRYVVPVESTLLTSFRKIIPSSEARSDKWISTSALESDWNTAKIKHSSAEYFVNNLLNPVYFQQATRYIPDNAIVVELAPYGLLQSILKRSLPASVHNMTLTSKNQNDPDFFLKSIGQLYETGCTPKISKLYLPVSFPVSRGTPMISPLIKWQHDEEWPMPLYAKKPATSGERDIVVSTRSPEYQYLTGHVVNEKNLFPAAGYLVLVWETMAQMEGKDMKNLSIVFENVRFERVTNIPKEGEITFHVSVQKYAGNFEITENRAILASGKVYVPENVDDEKLIRQAPDDDAIDDPITDWMNGDDFYKEKRLRGCQYEGIFKTAVSCNLAATRGRVLWCDNFTAFLDVMVQVTVVSFDTRECMIPSFVRKIVCDVNEHFEILKTLNAQRPEFPVRYYPENKVTRCGGIQVIGLKNSAIVRKRNTANITLEKYQFVPYIDDQVMELNQTVRICVHIACENTLLSKMKILLLDRFDDEMFAIATVIAESLDEYPSVQKDLKIWLNAQSVHHQIPEDVEILKAPPSNGSYAIAVTDAEYLLQNFEYVFNTLKNDGFVITIVSNSQSSQLNELELITCFSRPVDSRRKISLLRKNIPRHIAGTIHVENTSDQYPWIPQLQRILPTLPSDQILLLYAEREPHNGILGFFNCLRKEEHGNKTRCFFLMDTAAPKFTPDASFYRRQIDKNLSHNVYKDDQWGSYRHLLLEPPEPIDVTHAYNTLQIRGDLSTLEWIEGPLKPKRSQPENPIVQVYYSSLNFRDIMLSTGKITPVDLPIYNRLLETYNGIEFSGKDNTGVRYMGMVPSKGIASLVEADPQTTWVVPRAMTLEDASTIPVAYLTVIYGLLMRMHLKRNSSVLIHAASGAVGQAAINICLHYDCELFVTVGTDEKRQFIERAFPQIPRENIANSRDTSFERSIMSRTRGRGVHVVLNSLADDKLNASLRCLAVGGYFVEIGKFDMAKNNNLPMAPLLKDITFLSVQLDVMMASSSPEKTLLRDIMQRMLDNDVVKPLHRTTFRANDVESAFRYMSSGKHIGKVVIQIRNEHDVHAESTPRAFPRVLCDKHHSYVITGGLGGFGIELADWLIVRGAKHLILNSKRGLRTGYQRYRLKVWRSYGVRVIVNVHDISTENGVRELLRAATVAGPVTGIFHLAATFDDRPFDEQNRRTFAVSADPKSVAVRHLDKLSRTMCPRLKHFVVFSSVSCGRGNINQTNYGMSNSIMERVCETRLADRLPALAIQWGAVADVGIVADRVQDNTEIVIGGTRQQPIVSCLRTLDTLMNQPHAVVASMIVAEKRTLHTDIVQTIANILGIKDLKTISSTWTLPELGMDSVMVVELKQIIESEFDVFLTARDVKSMTFEKLRDMKERKAKSKISPAVEDRL